MLHKHRTNLGLEELQLGGRNSDRLGGLQRGDRGDETENQRDESPHDCLASGG